MRYFVLAMSSLISSAQPALSAVSETSAKFWVDETEKVVVVAPNPTLTVKLSKIAADDEYYGLLDISLNYLGSDVAKQLSAIGVRYPGYAEKRIVIEKSGAFHYEIPLLTVNRDIEPTRGTEGPFVNDQIYVNKKQFVRLQNEMGQGHSLATFSGQLSGTVPLTRVKEHKELDGSVCTKLLGREANIGELISKTATLSQGILASSQFEFDSTREALLKDIKSNCFEISSPLQASSFADLLGANLKARNLDRKLVGETREKFYGQEKFSLSYEIDQQLPGAN